MNLQRWCWFNCNDLTARYYLGRKGVNVVLVAQPTLIDKGGGWGHGKYRKNGIV